MGFRLVASEHEPKLLNVMGAVILPARESAVKRVLFLLVNENDDLSPAGLTRNVGLDNQDQVLRLGRDAEGSGLLTFLLVARLCLSAFLLPSSVRKLANLQQFVEGTVAYRVVPERAARIIGTTVPWIEMWLAMAFALGVALPMAGVLAAVLLASFCIAMSLNLRRGRELACNCYGIAETTTISWGTVARTGLLLTMALAVAGISTVLVPADRWWIPWGADRAAMSSPLELLLLAFVVGCCIALVYLLEWGLDIQGRIANLGPTRPASVDSGVSTVVDGESTQRMLTDLSGRQV